MDNSPFGKLPAEIRARIFSLAMPNAKCIRFQLLSRGVAGWYWESDNIEDIRSTPAFTRTCRQFLEESAPLFYSTESFVFESFFLLKTFVDAIGDRNAKSIRHATVHAYSVTYMDLNEPADPNRDAFARKQLRSTLDYAKQRGWTSQTSLRLYLTFRERSFYAQCGFDLLQLGNDWGELEWKCYYEPPQASVEVEFFSRVENEIQVWKEEFLKAHERHECGLVSEEQSMSL